MKEREMVEFLLDEINPTVIRFPRSSLDESIT
jgi:hypothetical protein